MRYYIEKSLGHRNGFIMSVIQIFNQNLGEKQKIKTEQKKEFFLFYF